ncbi:hypothetical protein Pan44_44250 [Caulifigura coniformis]|uniref:DUF1559 domain-containing protein n=1 Tax=Caulifigura coniformis TaxID=2527983 RepID=A0A517SJR7_9PLAN|nr:DUF1559 domain-containing protein [Caulifigura coniformis]QDT56371.1 hypothetical protein Pan44_44250 [Caulifigura coniformis]
MRLTHPRTWVCAGVLALAISGIAWSFAPDAASSGALLHPAESVVYVSFDGSVAHDAAFKKTAAYAALYESGLMGAFTKAAERLKQSAAGNVSDKEFEQLGKMIGLANHAIERGLSMSIVVQPPAGGPPTASATVVLNQGASFRALVEGQLREALANEPEFHVEEYSDGGKPAGIMVSREDGPMGAKFTLFEKSGHLVLNVATTSGGKSPAREVSFQALGGQGKNVSSHPLYRDPAAERDFIQNGIGWLDFKPLKAMFGGMPLPPTRSGAQISVDELLSILGVDTLESVVSRSGFRDRATWTETRVIAPGPRKGLMGLIDQPTFTISDLPPLPKQPFTILASSVDAGAAYDRLVGVFKAMSEKVDPNAIGQFDQGLAQVEAQIGFSIRNDLLGPLKGVMAFAADGGGSQSLDSLQFSLQVSDAERFRATLQKIFDLAAQASQGQVTFETVTKYGREMSVMRIRQAPIVVPTICVDRKFAHVGLLPQAVEMALLRTDGKLPGWKPDGDTAEALKLMPEKMTSFSYSDAPMMYGRLIGQAPLLLGLIQTATAQAAPQFEFPLKAEDLPPAELVSASLFPNIAVGTVDADGAKNYTRNSLPGSEMLLSTAGIGVGAALVLPAVQQAREAARRTQSKNNLKQILLALHNYYDTHNALPPGAVPVAGLKPEERLSWQVMMLPYLEQAALYNQLDVKAGWNQGANEAVVATEVEVFLHPSVPRGAPGGTNYVGIAGLGVEGPTLDAKNPKAGIFAYDKPRTFREVTDGLSNTAMVAETNRPAPWAQGGPGTIRPLTTEPYINGPDGIGGVSVGGANIGMGDGSVRFVSDKIDPRVMEAISTIAGGEPVDDF